MIFKAIRLPSPTDEPEFFKQIKRFCEKHWEGIKIKEMLIGFQIQPHTKWRKGLSEEELSNFEKDAGISFPFVLKNFYRTMNGLDKPAVNVYSDVSHKHIYHPYYYSYPEDIQFIKDQIEAVFIKNGLTDNDLLICDISRIFPVGPDTYLLVDVIPCPVIYTDGDEVVFRADSLSKFIVTDIFENIENHWEYDLDPNNVPKINYWSENREIDDLSARD